MSRLNENFVPCSSAHNNYNNKYSGYALSSLTLTIGTAGMDAVRPRSVIVVDLRLLNAEDRCRLLLGELPDGLARSDRLALMPPICLAMVGGRIDDSVDDVNRDGDGLRNWCSKMRFSSKTASGGGSSSGR